VRDAQGECTYQSIFQNHHLLPKVEHLHFQGLIYPLKFSALYPSEIINAIDFLMSRKSLHPDLS